MPKASKEEQSRTFQEEAGKGRQTLVPLTRAHSGVGRQGGRGNYRRLVHGDSVQPDRKWQGAQREMRVKEGLSKKRG